MSEGFSATGQLDPVALAALLTLSALTLCLPGARQLAHCY